MIKIEAQWWTGDEWRWHLTSNRRETIGVPVNDTPRTKTLWLPPDTQLPPKAQFGFARALEDASTVDQGARDERELRRLRPDSELVKGTWSELSR